MERLREGLTLAWQIGGRANVAEGLEGVAGVAVYAGDMKLAASLLGLADALLEAIGATRPAGARSRTYVSLRTAALNALGVNGFTAVWSAGHALTPAEAVAVAVAFTPHSPFPAIKRNTSEWDRGPSPRRIG